MAHAFPHSLVLSSALIAALGLSIVPARADRCDEQARELAGRIEGLKVGRAAGGIIYLQHPLATQASLGCSSRNRQADFFAASPARKPPAAFVEMVATAAAVIFTIPRKDALRGANRCFERIGILRGKDIKTRYRKLDIQCQASKSGSSITISREKDQ
ncbi:MAG: hypothetical protein J0G28_10425 [Afipia sp.]|mgnify:FL=1|nr:hypothetical protein [Afipia sp.]OJW62849.1 MAG: hypothetical protein BGO65_11515 [Afipia sp. 64-13]